eukprot:scaffold322814_cov18-Tisochrysis_lutea.AAC.1
MLPCVRSGRSKARSGGAAAGGAANKAATSVQHKGGGGDREGGLDNRDWPGGAMEIDGGEEEEEEADGEATAGSVCAALRNVFGGGKSGRGKGKRSVAEAGLEGREAKEVGEEGL